jgi:hypothetical protein
MSGHTPGPWNYEQADSCCLKGPIDFFIRIYAEDPGPENDFTIGLVRDADGPTREAHARLVAAAPLMLQALEAHQAWAWAEGSSPRISTFNENMELCQYANWLTAKALAAVNGHPVEVEYEGVPHMTVWPTVGIDRAEQGEAQAIVDRILAAYRAATEPKS